MYKKNLIRPIFPTYEGGQGVINNTFYHIYNSPIGKIYILADEQLLKEVLFYNNDTKGYIETHFKKGSNSVIEKTNLYFKNYFNSNKNNLKCRIYSYQKNNFKTSPHIIDMDVSAFTEKEVMVYEELIKVRAGMTISYKGLAEKAGIPGGARFVGNAMAKNIFPILIPCHRVIKEDGSIGNYSGGEGIKERLLDHEKTAP